MHSIPRKDYLEKGKDSVISYLPAVYPAEAYRHRLDDKKRSIPRDEIDLITLELTDRGLRGDIIDPQVILD